MLWGGGGVNIQGGIKSMRVCVCGGAYNRKFGNSILQYLTNKSYVDLNRLWTHSAPFAIAECKIDRFVFFLCIIS